MTRMISVSGIEKTPAVLRSCANAVLTALAALAPPTLRRRSPDAHVGRRRRPRGSGRACRSLCAVAADLELDQRCVPARAIWPASADERRVDVLHRCHRFKARYYVLHGRVEGRLPARSDGSRSGRSHSRQLEPGIEDPVHAAGLPWPRLVRVRLLGPDLAAEGERGHTRRASRTWLSSSGLRSSGRRGPTDWPALRRTDRFAPDIGLWCTKTVFMTAPLPEGSLRPSTSSRRQAAAMDRAGF